MLPKRQQKRGDGSSGEAAGAPWQMAAADGPAHGAGKGFRMKIPVIVGNRVRYRLRWRLIRFQRLEDGYQFSIWGHPALQVAMTPAGFEFTQIDWYTLTFSYKRRRLLALPRGDIEPARLLFGVASGWFGFLYLGLYVSDWRQMLRAGELPVEVGHIGRGGGQGAQPSRNHNSTEASGPH